MSIKKEISKNNENKCNNRKEYISTTFKPALDIIMKGKRNAGVYSEKNIR